MIYDKQKLEFSHTDLTDLFRCEQRVFLFLRTKKSQPVLLQAGMILNTNNSNSTNFWELFGLLEMEVDFLQPFPDIEARTALANPGKVAMA
ncbi:Uncharacterised protein [Segatella copri]|nr:Uncharacterised protein [Segatella copri]